MAEPKHNERFERSHQRFVPGWDRESVTVSDQVMARIAKKKELMRGITLFSCETRAPAPSKDLCHLVITEKGVMWRKWKISLRGMTSGSAPVPQPVEECMSYIDFRCDDALMGEVKRAFGENTFSQIEYIVSGRRDFLTCLSKQILLKIAVMLDLQTITSLSYVNRFMYEFCNSDMLWGKLYSMHQAAPSCEIFDLAKSLTWKVLFYMSKLQLQKELSRRRKHLNSAHPATTLDM